MNREAHPRVIVGALVTAVGIAAMPRPASAQEELPPAAYFEFEQQTNTFQSLSDRCSGSITTRFFSSTSGVQIPFTFEFLGTDYDEVFLNQAGYISFQSCATCGSNNTYDVGTDEPFPDAADPNYLIAGFWNELSRSSGFGSFPVESCVLGTAPNRQFVIEYRDFQIDSGSGGVGDGSMQFWLYEQDGQFEVHYSDDELSTQFGSPVGLIGYEASGQEGDFYDHFLTCSETEDCTSENWTGTSPSDPDVQGTRIVVEKGEDPDVTVEFPNFLRGALPGEAATGTVTVLNRGINSASNVDVDLYLSTDDILDPSDTLVGSFSVANAPNGRTNREVTINVPQSLPAADYFFIGEADPLDTIDEPIEDNNIVVSDQKFATFHDPAAVGCAVTTPGGVNPGETADIDVTIENRGAPFTDPLDVALFASTDDLFQGSDPAFDPNIVTLNTLTRQNRVVTSVQTTVPNGLAPGRYFPICQLDPNSQITENNTNNNLVVGEETFQSGSDYAVTALSFNKLVEPGSTLDVELTLSSLAVPAAEDVEYQLYASEDDALDRAVDVPLLTGSLSSVTFDGVAAEATGEDSITLPSTLGPGRYFVIVDVDPRNRIDEVSEDNNTGTSANLSDDPQFFNAFDFLVQNARRSSSASTVQIGDTVEVTFDITSVGLEFSGFLDFAVFFSSDPEFDFGDIVAASGRAFISGTGTGNDTTRVTFAFDIDSSIPPGSFNIAILADSTESWVEATEENNAAVITSITEVQGADLSVDEFLVQDTVFAGGTMRTQISIENRAQVDAIDFNYAYLFSEDDLIRESDDVIFVSDDVTVEAADTVTFEDEVPVPSTFTSTATRFLGVVLDWRAEIPDGNLRNNIRRATPVEPEFPTGTRNPGTPLLIVLPAPDFDTRIISTATSAAGGEELAITRSIANLGNDDAMNMQYCYYMSVNPVISPDDDILLPIRGGSSSGCGEIDLVQDEDDIAVDIVDVPSGIPDGNYYVGLLANANGALREVFTDNNAAVTPEPIPVFEAIIQFTTRSFPRATLGVPYEVGVFAQGGAQPITWEETPGTELPPGLELDAQTGIISGEPEGTGRFDFGLRANSGTAFADKEFFIIVTPPTVQLDVVTPLLPSGIANRAYDEQLLAVGGAPPYTWTALNPDAIPEGLAFTEDGRLSGTPVAPGSTSVVFRVTDSLGVEASDELPLRVLNPNQTVQIQQTPLPSPIVEVPLACTEEEGDVFGFVASNGTPPYRWAIVGDPPPGLELESDTGILCGEPSMAGNFPFEVRVQDETGLFDTALFVLTVDDGTTLAISTFAVPRGEEDQPYEQTFDAIRGEEPYVWSLVEEVSTLPPGLELTQDGELRGTPEEGGRFGFSVRVEDQLGRTDVQPLSLLIEPKAFCEKEENQDDPLCVPEDTGCTAVRVRSGALDAGSALALFLGALGLVTLRRRRRG